MLLRLIAFEWKYHARQMVFRVAALGYLLFGIAMGSSRPPFGAGILANSPYAITYFCGLLSLGTGIIIALLAGGAILRDAETKMEPLIFTTNISKVQYVVSRFIGLASMAFFAFACGVLGLFIGSQLPMVDPDTLGAIQPGAYFWCLLVLGIPNILFGTAIIFFTGAITRNAMATYISGLFIYVLYFLASMLGGSPLMAVSAGASTSGMTLSALVDPYGMVSFLEQTAPWSVLQRNTQLAGLSGIFLVNRLLWIGFSLGLFYLTFKKFSFRTLATKKVKAEKDRDAEVQIKTYRPIAPAGRDWRRTWLAFVSQTRMGVRTVVKGLPYYALLLMWVFIVGVNLSNQLIRGDRSVPYVPLTGILLPGIMLPMLILGAMAVVFYAAELVWSERGHRMDGLLDATPAPNGAFWAAKVAAIAVIVAGFIAVTILLGIFIQIANGHFQFDLGLYASLFIRAGLPLVLFGVLAVFLQALIRNKYAGMAAGFVGIIISFTPFLKAVGLNNPLIRYASMPDFIYSPMAETGYHDSAMMWFIIYGGALAGLLSVGTLRLWRRGLRTLQLGSTAKIVAGVCLLAAIGAGSVIYLNSVLLAPYESSRAQYDWQEAYERKYRAYAEEPRPSLTRVDLDITLDPDAGEANISGRLSLVNRRDTPLQNLLIGLDRDALKPVVSLSGATVTDPDANLNQYRLRFDPPLTQGSEATLEFAFTMRKSRFQSLDPNLYLLPNAAYVDVGRVLPAIGYNPDLEIWSVRERGRRGLPELPDEPPVAIGRDRGDIQVAVVVSTKKDHTVVGAGEPLRTWETQNRKHFQFQATQPNPFWFTIASAPYAQKSVEMGTQKAVVYHHPDHDYNVDRMLAAARDAHQYYREQFGEEPKEGIQLAEVPQFSQKFRVMPFPHTMFGVENGIFLFNQSRGRPDLAYRAVAHKFGHRWWNPSPALTERDNLLTEILATYTEMVLFEKGHDKEATKAHVRLMNSRYFRFRSVMRRIEQPLALAQNQPYIYRLKGPHVVYALREELGEAHMNYILKPFLQDPSRLLSASTVLEAMLSGATEEVRLRIRELLVQVVTYDLELVHAELSPGEAGHYRVQLEIQADKGVQDDEGKRQYGPVQGSVEIGLYAEGELLRLERVMLEAETQTVILSSERKPDEVILDPRMLRLEPDITDNRKSLTQITP